VAAQLRLAGVHLRRQGVPADRIDEAAKLDCDGWPCQRHGERYDCDAETMRQALKRAGDRLRVRGSGLDGPPDLPAEQDQ
jgi:hypothetical protein